MERLLDGVDAVVYLLDYTKLRTSEEAALFTRLKQINPGSGPSVAVMQPRRIYFNMPS